MSGKIVVLQENKLFWGAPSVAGPCLEVQLRGVRSMMLVPAATLAREKNVTSTKAEGAPYNQDIMRRLSSTVMQRAPGPRRVRGGQSHTSANWERATRAAACAHAHGWRGRG